ncbi:Na+ dependent nucleoside transporter [bacterium]|nr:Na+ dependent nucleoside transporter [bacterium]
MDAFLAILRALLATTVFLGIAYLLSSNKKLVNKKQIIWGLLLQLSFAIAVLKVPFVKDAFRYVANAFNGLLQVSEAGAEFLFGNLIDPSQSWGYLFAFKVLPTIVFFSAIMSLFYYLGIMQRIVYFFALVMKKTMKLSGAESLAAAANIFVGQTEAPLMVKPYIEKMTKSEIMALMTGGMATIAGAVLATYIGFLGDNWAGISGEAVGEARTLFATHLLCASIISAPAALLFAKIMMPETEKVNEELIISKEKSGKNVLDAISNGTTQGVKLAVNVGAMLLVFTAIMYGLNLLMGWVGEVSHLNEQIAVISGGKFDKLSLQFVLGYLMAPVAWLIGVANEDITMVGMLLGEKTVLNEFYAYASLADLIKGNAIGDEKSVIIATYALCGFANFASIGIQIGGIGVLAPGKRVLLSTLGVKALIAGTLACLMTAVIAGVLI